MPPTQLSAAEKLLDRLAADWPVDAWRDVHVVVAVSGGADSVALLRALDLLRKQNEGRGKLYVGHFNHCLRGAESDRDEHFVSQLASTLGLPVHLGRADDRAENEETAREQRYAFLRSIAHQLGARYVATAHTLDDQAETVLLRALRGTGLAGLAGIPFSRALGGPRGNSASVVRPLLAISRQQVEAFLAELQQSFCQDATNTSSAFTRNWIRNELMPPIRNRFGEQTSARLAGLAEQAAEAHEFVAEQASKLASKAFVVDPSGSEISVDCKPLQTASALLVRQAVREAWGRAGWPEQAMARRDWIRLSEFLLSATALPAITLPAEVRLQREEGLATLSRRC